MGLDLATEWVRCGNTPYYRSGSGFNWFFADPFNWNFISTAQSVYGGIDEGVIALVHYHATRYDWDSMIKGIHYIAEARADQLRIMGRTHEWAVDLMNAPNRNVNVLRKMFEAAPLEAQRDVLNGVRALVGGMVQDDLEKIGKPPQAKTKTLLVIQADTPAEDRIEEIEEMYGRDVVGSIVDSSLERGFERGLANFKIYEC